MPACCASRWEMCPFHPAAGGCLGGRLWAAGNHPAEQRDLVLARKVRYAESTTDCQPSLGGMAPENVDVDLTVLFSPITLFGGFPLVSSLAFLSHCDTSVCCKARDFLTGKLNPIARSIDIYYKCLSWANNP